MRILHLIVIKLLKSNAKNSLKLYNLRFNIIIQNKLNKIIVNKQ